MQIGNFENGLHLTIPLHSHEQTLSTEVEHPILIILFAYVIVPHFQIKRLTVDFVAV